MKNSPADVFTKPNPRGFISRMPRAHARGLPRVGPRRERDLFRPTGYSVPIKDRAVSKDTRSWVSSSPVEPTISSGVTPLPLMARPDGAR